MFLLVLFIGYSHFVRAQITNSSTDPGDWDSCTTWGNPSSVGNQDDSVKNINDSIVVNGAYSSGKINMNSGGVLQFASGGSLSFNSDGTDIACFSSVVTATGRTWMAFNLGATGVATSVDEFAQYGSLYQWGRGTDGHELITYTSANAGSGVNITTGVSSGSDQPLNSSFIITFGSPNDWRSPQNDSLWQGVSGINNPCPPGYRLPTIAEWRNEFILENINSLDLAFQSSLRLLAAGMRSGTNGNVLNVGVEGSYWCSSVVSDRSELIAFRNTGWTDNRSPRSDGASVRCIQD